MIYLEYIIIIKTFKSVSDDIYHIKIHHCEEEIVANCLAVYLNL